MSDRALQLSAASFDAPGLPSSLIAEGPLRVDVIAVDAADVVRSAGGWLFNRSRHGWAVNVFLVEHYHGQALQILGAKVLPLQYLSELPTSREGPHLFAAAADVIGLGNGACTGVAKVLTRARGRVVVWGSPLPTKLDRGLENLQHRLTPAGLAFKAHAMRAVEAEDTVPGPSEQFRGHMKAMTPCDFDLV